MSSRFIIFFALLFSFPPSSWAGCKSVYKCSSYGTCYYCAETCNRCVKYLKQDSEYPQQVMNLPINFNYSKVDDNLSNDKCGSSACGEKNCNAGATQFSANQLPVSPGACFLDPVDQIPAELNFKYKDGACETYCSKRASYSCCKSGSWEKVCD